MSQFDLFQPRSHGNYLKYTLESSKTETWMSYDVPKVELNSFSTGLESAISSARLVYEKYGGPINLPISGGVDSECMVRAFEGAKIPVKLVTMRFKNGYNQHDLDDVYKYYDRDRVKVIELDLDQFYSQGTHLEYALKYQCSSPQVATHIWLAHQLEGCVVFPHNPPAIILSKDKRVIFKFPLSLFHSYDKYFDHNQRPGVGMFFYYTPELLHSFVCSSVYKNIVVDSEAILRKYTWNDYLIKTSLYRSVGFKIQDRKDKFTGFENYRRHLNEKHKMPSSLDFFDQNYRLPMIEISGDLCYRAMGKFDIKTLYSTWFP